MKTKSWLFVLGVLFLALLVAVGLVAKHGIDRYRSLQYQLSGRAAYERRDWDGAIREYTAALAHRRDASAFIGRGCAYESRGDLDSAIRDYSAAIQAAPQNAYAWADRGHAYTRKRDLTNALHDATEAIRLAPQTAIHYQYRGYIYGLQGDHEHQIQDYSRAILLEPQEAQVYLVRGTAYAEQKDWEKAIADYTRAIEFNARLASAFHYRGFAHSTRGELDDALSDYADALRLHPQDPLILDNRAHAWAKKGRWDKALADWSQAVDYAGTNVAPYNSLAWVLATAPRDDLRDGKEARRLAKRACELTDWKQWAVVDTLAAACAELGDFEQALSYQNQALILAKVPPPDAPSAETRKGMEQRLALYQRHQPYRETPQ